MFHVCLPRLSGLLCAVAFCAGLASDVMAQQRPIRALLVLGGCCHDYPKQQKLLTEGISKRTEVEWTVSFDPDRGTTHLNPWYEKENWAEGFDVVIHDGRNQILRRMAAATGVTIERLIRVGMGPIKLGELTPGKWREIKGNELLSLQRVLHINP